VGNKTARAVLQVLLWFGILLGTYHVTLAFAQSRMAATIAVVLVFLSTRRFRRG